MLSILIRNKNEAGYLENTLSSIRKQELNFDCEIIFIDDHSTDNSVEIAEKYGCKVFLLDRDFSYGYALNFGISKCSFELILFLSSHITLLTTRFLEDLVQQFSDRNIAAVRCTPILNVRQVMQSAKEPLLLTKENYSHSIDWENLIVANCSAVRKTVATAILFNEEISANEEKQWCLKVLDQGFVVKSNVPCYFLYTKKKHSNSFITDATAKFQIDGIATVSKSNFFLSVIKGVPWALKIAAKTYWSNIVTKYSLMKIPLSNKKGVFTK